MNRERAIRTAAGWRIGMRVQRAGQTEVKQYESISLAKKASRVLGRCVVLQAEERGQGEFACGFFRSEGKA